MQIPQQLPQFDRRTGFLLVTGKQRAFIYRAFHGRIEKVLSLEIPKPRYSDREGFFAKTAGGQQFASGSELKDIDEQVRKQLIKKLRLELAAILQSQSVGNFELYLFSPANMVTLVFESLPKSAQSSIKNKIVGNYTNYHPLKLLELVKPEEKRTGLLRPMAQKILEKFRAARRIIGK